MLRAASLLVVVLALAGCSGGDAAPPTSAAEEPAGDVALLVEHVATVHPDPWHDVSEEEFRAAGVELEADWAALDANERLVGLMRLLALLGPRDGHSGIFPLDPAHEQELTLFPLRLYECPDGVFVVAAEDESLVGMELEAIGGVTVEKLRERVAPLVPRDNNWSLAARVPQWLVTAEVLAGLGVLEEPGPATFTFAGGVETELRPVPASAYAAAQPDLFHPMVPQASRAPRSPRTSPDAARSAGRGGSTTGELSTWR